MPLVRQYRHVQMPLERGGPPKAFFPLRAVGLAVETAWKKARDDGVVTADALQEVALTGQNLQILEDRQYRKVRACTLQLQQEDAQLASKIFHSQWKWLHDLKANPWFADKDFPTGCGQGAFDLICYLFEGKKIGIEGRLWVELKVFSAGSCKSSMDKAEKVLKVGLGKLRKKDQTLGGVLLLVASVENGRFKLLARLLAVGSEKFKDLTPAGLRVATGQTKITKKPALAAIWPQMEWHWLSRTREVGLVSQFLHAMGRARDNAGDRSEAFNELLKAHGCKKEIEHVKIPHRPGPKVWACGRDEFEILYNCL